MRTNECKMSGAQWMLINSNSFCILLEVFLDIKSFGIYEKLGCPSYRANKNKF